MGKYSHQAEPHELMLLRSADQRRLREDKREASKEKRDGKQTQRKSKPKSARKQRKPCAQKRAPRKQTAQEAKSSEVSVREAHEGGGGAAAPSAETSDAKDVDTKPKVKSPQLVDEDTQKWCQERL